MKRLVIYFAAAIATIGCAPRNARAQFVGYVSPQTVVQNFGTTISCTGSPQSYAVANLGQTQHFATITPNSPAQRLRMEIDGVDRNGNQTRISDLVEGVTASQTITASGYFPQVLVIVTCSGGTLPSYTLTYSGASATNIAAIVGSYQISQVDKLIFNAAPANTTVSEALQTPFASSGGTLYFQYLSGVSLAGSTVTVACQGEGTSGTPLTIATFSITSAPLSIQTFRIPAAPCTHMLVTYTSGGASSLVYDVEIVFNTPGTQNFADPCGGPNKSSVLINAAATATTQIVAPVANQTIYPCGYQGTMSAAGAFEWVYGTSACSVGLTFLTGAESILASTPVLDGDNGQTIMNIPPGNGLCIITLTAGIFNGKLTYVQQ